jgi:hypothetical protein
VKFLMQHLIFSESKPTQFTESTAPDWLTGEKTIKGSTMDTRWFWTEHVLTLDIGKSVLTDFHAITRIE